MSALHEDSHRRQQRQFDKERLADRIEQWLFRTALMDDERCEAPVPAWKQMEWARDVLSEGDSAGARS